MITLENVDGSFTFKAEIILPTFEGAYENAKGTLQLLYLQPNGIKLLNTWQMIMNDFQIFFLLFLFSSVCSVG